MPTRLKMLRLGERADQGALPLPRRLLWEGDLPGYTPDGNCYPRGELPRPTAKLGAFLGHSPSGADEMGYYQGQRAVLAEAGFERGARAWLVRWAGGTAISCVAVVSSAEAAAKAAAGLIKVPADPGYGLPAELVARWPRSEVVHSEIALPDLPHAGGMRVTSAPVGRPESPSTDTTITVFADDRLVYFLWTYEQRGPAAPLTDEELAGSMQALYRRVHGRPLPRPTTRGRRGAAPQSVQLGPPSLLWRRELEVASDYGQIYICDRAAVFEEVEDPLQEAFADAVESGRHVGVAEGFVVLLTPGQWSEHLPMLMEGWSSEPPDDGADWQHQVDVDLPLPSGVIVFEASGGGDFNEATVPAGDYRARISGRGFTQAGVAGADGAESYRIQLWPAVAPEAPILRKAWPGWSTAG